MSNREIHENVMPQKFGANTVSTDLLTKAWPIIGANNCAQSQSYAMSWVRSADAFIVDWFSFVQSGLRCEIIVDWIRFKCRHAFSPTSFFITSCCDEYSIVHCCNNTQNNLDLWVFVNSSSLKICVGFEQFFAWRDMVWKVSAVQSQKQVVYVEVPSYEQENTKEFWWSGCMKHTMYGKKNRKLLLIWR